MKKNQSFFTMVFAIYIFAGVFSVWNFHSNGSKLSRQLDIAASVATDSPSNIEIISENELNRQPDVATENSLPNRTPVNEISGESLEPETSYDETSFDETPIDDAPIDETPIDELPIEASPSEEALMDDDSIDEESIDFESSDDTIREEDSDELLAEESESETENDDSEDADNDSDKIYYGYKVNSGVTGVRVRETSERNSDVVGHISDGDTGYILEVGDIRSKILLTDGTIGYVYNEYIQIVEISSEDVPEEYR
ncbi:MAG: hypothetical protein J6B28_05710 [Eubacterium sp.]|nr:hypothetical protein [Eubacterium sp.]